MKSFKQQLKEEGAIFIHNFVTVVSLLMGWNMLLHAPNLAGNILGFITLTYGIWLLVTAIKKGVDEILKTYFPHIIEELKNNINKKGDF